MDSRLDFSQAFRTFLGSNNVYFQEPEKSKMEYDAIRYTLDDMNTLRADNLNYKITPTYEVMIITEDPDTTLPKRFLEMFSTSRFHRHFVADNLHHYVLSLY